MSRLQLMTLVITAIDCPFTFLPYLTVISPEVFVGQIIRQHFIELKELLPSGSYLWPIVRSLLDPIVCKPFGVLIRILQSNIFLHVVGVAS